MTEPNRASFAIVVMSLTLSGAASAAQRFEVKIVDRQSNGGSYTYVVPGSSNSTSTSTANCVGGSGVANCSGSTNTTSSATPAFVGSYQVTGATLSLQLADGRVAIVNCASKVNWTEWNMNAHRSCRVPLVSNVQAEFDGDSAKLKWSVSLDGKKMESETYKILAVLNAP